MIQRTLGVPRRMRRRNQNAKKEPLMTENSRFGHSSFNLADLDHRRTDFNGLFHNNIAHIQHYLDVYGAARIDLALCSQFPPILRHFRATARPAPSTRSLRFDHACRSLTMCLNYIFANFLWILSFSRSNFASFRLGGTTCTSSRISLIELGFCFASDCM